MRKFTFLIFTLILAASITFPQKTRIGGRVNIGGKANVYKAAGACAFPCTAVIDNFNTNGGPPPPGGLWTSSIFSSDSGLVVTSNQLAANSTVPSSAYITSDAGPDCEVYNVLKNVSSERPGLMGRMTSVGTSTPDGYYLFVVNSTTLRLFRVDDGSNTALGADFSQSMAANDSIGMSLIGTTITVYYKASAGSWTSLGNRVDGTYTAAGKIGARAIDNANGVFADDFGGGTIP